MMDSTQSRKAGGDATRSPFRARVLLLCAALLHLPEAVTADMYDVIDAVAAFVAARQEEMRMCCTHILEAWHHLGFVPGANDARSIFTINLPRCLPSVTQGYELR